MTDTSDSTADTPSGISDPLALRETATLLAHHLDANEFDSVWSTLVYLHHSGRSINAESIREFGPESLAAEAARDIALHFVQEGLITKNTIARSRIDLAFTIAKVQHANTEDAPPVNKIVGTFPEDDPAFTSQSFGSLLSETLKLIREADEHLVLLSPFLSEQAFEKYRPALRSAADYGADITLITNSLTYGKDSYNRKFVNALFDDRRIATQTTVYEYVNRESWDTFHAKVITTGSDGPAYLGTANFTHKGLLDNLELGVIFHDKTAHDLNSLMDTLLKSEFTTRITRADGWFYTV